MWFGRNTYQTMHKLRTDNKMTSKFVNRKHDFYIHKLRESEANGR